MDVHNLGTWLVIGSDETRMRTIQCNLDFILKYWSSLLAMDPEKIMTYINM